MKGEEEKSKGEKGRDAMDWGMIYCTYIKHL